MLNTQHGLRTIIVCIQYKVDQVAIIFLQQILNTIMYKHSLSCSLCNGDLTHSIRISDFQILLLIFCAYLHFVHFQEQIFHFSNKVRSKKKPRLEYISFIFHRVSIQISCLYRYRYFFWSQLDKITNLILRYSDICFFLYGLSCMHLGKFSLICELTCTCICFGL